MPFKPLRSLPLATALCAAALAAPAAAQAPPAAAQAPHSGWSASANVALVSDYRFRGVSLSDRDPALQGAVDLESDTGFTAGIWASPVADTGGAHTEIDIYGGYKRQVHGFDLAVGAYSYLYPGGTGVNYLELQASAQHAAGPVRLGVLAAWTPRQRNVRDTDNLYLQASATVPLGSSPFSVRTALGYENGLFAGKWDWDAGLRYERAWGTASLGLVGSTRRAAAPADPNGRTTLLAGVTLAF